MSVTKIDWTDHSLNPGVYGCSPAGEGCRNCYAAVMAHRLAAMGQDQYAGTTESRDGRVQWRPHGSRQDYDQTTHWGGVTVDYDQIPRAFAKLPKRKPARVFVTSMGDLYHRDVPGLFIWQTFREMTTRPHQVFQVLTKRPERIAPWWAEYVELFRKDGKELTWPPNVWIGCSCSTQADVDRMVPELLRVPAAVRFLSLEPLLGAVTVEAHVWRTRINNIGTDIYSNDKCPDWLIIGAESGPRRRPCQDEWVHDIVDMCVDADVPVFCKQLSRDHGIIHAHLQDGSPNPDWPDWARQDFPEETP